MEVFDGSSTASSRPGTATEVEVAGSSEVPCQVEAAFWTQIAQGLLLEESAGVKSTGVSGVAPAVEAGWFHNAGGMSPFDLKQQPSGRYLS